MDQTHYISIPEAAVLSGLSRAQLSLLAKTGRLKAFKVGRNWVTTPGAVAEYLANVELRSKDPYKNKRD